MEEPGDETASGWGCPTIADFFQNGDITTLHRLGRGDLAALERRLTEYSRDRGIALVLPCLFDELERPALRRIIQTITPLAYIQQVVIALGRATRHQFEQAKRYFSPLRRKGRQVRVLWNEGPRLQRFYRMLEDHGVEYPPNGKGRATWAAYGYLLASRKARVVVQHDADILHYDRDLVARLAYPVAHPESGLLFCKGYYSRTNKRMNGRVTRLFVNPLVRSMRHELDDARFLRQLDAYRYALSGECAMDIAVARQVRVPTDWGLEVGILAEVHRHLDPQQVAQVDIADTYDHKHKDLSQHNPGAGLQKMAIEVAQSLFNTLQRDGVPLPPDRLARLEKAYEETAGEYVHRYHLDAEINGLDHSMAEELEAVAVFKQALRTAIVRFSSADETDAWMPEWDHIMDHHGDLMVTFHEAVEADNRTPAVSTPKHTVAAWA